MNKIISNKLYTILFIGSFSLVGCKTISTNYDTGNKNYYSSYNQYDYELNQLEENYFKDLNKLIKKQNDLESFKMTLNHQRRLNAIREEINTLKSHYAREKSRIQYKNDLAKLQWEQEKLYKAQQEKQQATLKKVRDEIEAERLKQEQEKLHKAQQEKQQATLKKVRDEIEAERLKQEQEKLHKAQQEKQQATLKKVRDEIEAERLKQEQEKLHKAQQEKIDIETPKSALHSELLSKVKRID